MANKLTLAYARKYEPQHLVDELLQNMGWVDNVVCLDQRDRVDELWSNSDERVAELRRLAREAGALYCIIMAPEERMQDGAEAIIRNALLKKRAGSGFSFRLREMWTPTQYRSDGLWGDKRRRRITHLHLPEGERVNLDCDIMHLKMIEPENRIVRAQVHTKANTWDNRKTGFDYMVQEEGLTLKDARPFSPPYKEYRFTVPTHLL